MKASMKLFGLVAAAHACVTTGAFAQASMGTATIRSQLDPANGPAHIELNANGTTTDSVATNTDGVIVERDGAKTNASGNAQAAPGAPQIYVTPWSPYFQNNNPYGAPISPYKPVPLTGRWQ